MLEISVSDLDRDGFLLNTPDGTYYLPDGLEGRRDHIELYTDSKDLAVEQKLEAVLDTHGIFYDKTEVWIESEKLYEVLYSFEMEV